MNYTVVLSPDAEVGGFTASCPAMPGALSQGETREEALRNITEAMVGWYEVACEQGEGPLEETPALVAAEVESVLEDRAEVGWDLIVETALVACR